jgi:basic membrane lipoprotein Med (substrate-binding protein (PBP1-ABC) superfamily)
MKKVLDIVCCLLLLTACNKDIDETVTVDAPKGVATVTFLVTPNGLGDNNYNDAAAECIFAFAGETGTRLRLLLPGDEAEAETMYRYWLTDNAAQDSAVMILGSSAYETMARQVSATDSDKLKSLQERGGRVLLFESEASIDGISTVLVSHYGVSWLAGAMTQGFDALILAAATGVPALEESIAGFRDARGKYAGEYCGNQCKTTLHYLSDSEKGFAMPDSAYHYITRRAEETLNYDEFIFPLLGGSEAGVLRYLNDDIFTMALMVGMDVDQTGQSTRIPFSVVIRIGDVIRQYLNEWQNGHEWPRHLRLGISDGAADIVITPDFNRYLNSWDDRYADPDTFLKLYRQYKDEAIKKEAEYEK